MRSGVKAPQQLVDAAADVVQGALSSLSRGKIKVVVDGFPRHVRVDDASGGGSFSDDQQESIQKEELRLEDKIKGHFSYIPGLMVAVTVKLNTIKETTHEVKYDSKNVVQSAIETQSKASETNSGGSSAVEAGTVPNTALSVNTTPAPAAAAAPNTTSDESTKFKVEVPTTEINRINAGGDSTAVAAAVRVPLAYFAAIYTHENPSVKDPTEKQMRGLIDEQLPKIRKDVAMCAYLKSESDIAVETYMDPTPMMPVPQTATAGISISAIGGSHIREVVLGALALVSLFMVSMVVKKGTPGVALASATPSAPTGPVPTQFIDAGTEVAGEVGTGGATLDGMELDEDAIRTQQMLEQVSSLVKDNPDSAATLVKRWLNRA
jgi:flagellar biosynthesis/type III secretory pathway M-ring protein FliF/YscJ